MTHPCTNRLLTPAQYDSSIGGIYNIVGGWDIYHRIFWGVSTRAYKAFADRASLACAGGRLLDAGCGSMLFSAGAYLRNHHELVVGTDISQGMLRRARYRLGNERWSRHVCLTQADILYSPFVTSAFDVVICLHVAHVSRDLEGLLRELRRVLKPGGELFLTSAVPGNTWRNGYLRALARKGIMAPPRTAQEILAMLRNRFGVEPHSRLVGSMLFTETLAP
jgi:ubiquinone/menaquinone biosynthesis C-methylase UbiE